MRLKNKICIATGAVQGCGVMLNYTSVVGNFGNFGQTAFERWTRNPSTTLQDPAPNLRQQPGQRCTPIQGAPGCLHATTWRCCALATTPPGSVPGPRRYVADFTPLT